MFDEHLLCGRSSALHSINNNHVCSRLHRQLDIVTDTCGTELDVNRELPGSDFSELGNLDGEVVGPHPVGMPASRPLINALRQRSHLGDALPNFDAQKHAPSSRFGTLPDHHFDRVSLSYILRVETVTRW